MEPATKLSHDEIAQINKLRETYAKIRGELGKRIVGQDAVLEQFLTSFFAGGHCLLIGVPGLAKTLMIKSMAEILSLSFSRIQFTPDLLPADIVGTDVIVEDKSTRQRQTKFLRGPIFANVVLADEINRTPPKTQAALLESMEERRVTVGGNPYDLEPPFFVLATQNPIEQEGTYQLPIAALDRFMFNIYVDYPSFDEEQEIIKLTLPTSRQKVEQLLSKEDILSLLNIVRNVNAPEPVIQLATSIARASRPKAPSAPKEVRDYLNWGAGPRAPQCLIFAGKARAMLHGRYTVKAEDIVAATKPVLRHRLIANYHAEAEGKSIDAVIDRIVRHVTGEPEPVAETPSFWKRVQTFFAKTRPAEGLAPAQ